MRFPISALASFAVLAGFAVVVIAPQTGAAAERAVSFQRDVRPILSSHCFECHGADTQESNLRVDRRADLLKGGKSGRAVVPGRSAESRLLLLVSGKDKKLSMPPDGARLSSREVETLRRWIDQGAPFDEAAADPGPSADFWSFKPVRAERPPRDDQHRGDQLGPTDDFAANPIDMFIDARSCGQPDCPPRPRPIDAR